MQIQTTSNSVCLEIKSYIKLVGNFSEWNLELSTLLFWNHQNGKKLMRRKSSIFIYVNLSMDFQLLTECTVFVISEQWKKVFVSIRVLRFIRFRCPRYVTTSWYFPKVKILDADVRCWRKTKFMCHFSVHTFLCIISNFSSAISDSNSLLIRICLYIVPQQLKNIAVKSIHTKFNGITSAIDKFHHP